MRSQSSSFSWFTLRRAGSGTMSMEIVPSPSRASAFGWLALVRGIGLLVAGAALGLAYEHSPAWAIGLIVGINVVALVGLVMILRRIERRGAHR